ncbi:MAG: hypothetical protein WAK93_13195 [Solirubrobacteraceae bacterium]
MAEEREDTQEHEDAPRLDWSSAGVSDGTLTVPLTGEPSKPWKGVFERTVKLLGGGDWDEVTLKSGEVKVTGVHEGTEGSLRHFLEGAVQEANAALRAQEEEESHDEDDDKGSKDAGDDGDSRMTERFREFDA